MKIQALALAALVGMAKATGMTVSPRSPLSPSEMTLAPSTLTLTETKAGTITVQLATGATVITGAWEQETVIVVTPGSNSNDLLVTANAGATDTVTTTITSSVVQTVTDSGTAPTTTATATVIETTSTLTTSPTEEAPTTTATATSIETTGTLTITPTEEAPTEASTKTFILTTTSSDSAARMAPLNFKLW